MIMSGHCCVKRKLRFFVYISLQHVILAQFNLICGINSHTMQKLILASTSIYRKQLLEKFNLPFECTKPEIDESPLVNETPEALVGRLALQKAQTAASSYDNALIIGSDQVAVCNNTILGKPHTVEKAIAQLESFSGKTVTFLTGLCVFNSKTNQARTIVEPFNVQFKTLTIESISQYVHAELPLNCAGSFKSEGLGICLFEKLSGDDPNTLIGLPLIKLAELLKQNGLDVLAHQSSK